MLTFRPGGLELTDKALEIIDIKPGDKVLDIGCGLGTSLSHVRDKYGADVYGVDVAEESVSKAAETLGTDKVFCADACRLPFPDLSFDLLLMECVLTLINEPVNALHEAIRVLRPGGSIVITGLSASHQEKLCQEGRMDASLLAEYLETNGMELLLCSDETAQLRRFVAEIIFEYDSMQSYIEAANHELGGSVLSCEVPMKGTGYTLLVARKAKA